MSSGAGRCCAECGEQLGESAILCVHCGFHSGLGRKLERAQLFDQRSSGPLSDNPYFPVDGEQLGRDEPLTEEAAKRARAIADGAPPIYLSCLLTVCVCMPVLPLLLPLFTYRLASWWQLYTSHRQLREPNSLSPYAETELAFMGAGRRYIVSMLGGILVITVVAAIWISQLLRNY